MQTILSGQCVLPAISRVSKGGSMKKKYRIHVEEAFIDDDGDEMWNQIYRQEIVTEDPVMTTVICAVNKLCVQPPLRIRGEL